jgi:hypothetical protein
LFILCTWHAIAKLRLHTTTTLRYLTEATRSLGFILRKFAKKTCSAFETRELVKEVNARTRRKAATSAKKRGSDNSKGIKAVKSGKGKDKATGKSEKGKEKQQDSKIPKCRKLFNLYTYKLSTLGEYTWAILRYGTTDSYSTQTVCMHSQSNLLTLKNGQGELEHRRIKRFYARTNKNKTFVSQITKHVRCERVLRKVSQRVETDALNNSLPSSGSVQF